MNYTHKFYDAVFDCWQDWPVNLPFPIIPGSVGVSDLYEEDEEIHPVH